MNLELSEWERGYLAALVRDDIELLKDYNIAEMGMLRDNLQSLREKLSSEVNLTKGEVK
jgi:hypothetical protein